MPVVYYYYESICKHTSNLEQWLTGNSEELFELSVSEQAIDTVEEGQVLSQMFWQFIHTVQVLMLNTRERKE